MGVLIGSEKGTNGIIYKALMGNQPVDQGKKLEIGYEEQKESFGEILNDTTYKIYEIKPSEILEIFNEKIDMVEKIDPEVKTMLL